MISNERLTINGEGNVKLKLKAAWHNGATPIVLTPSDIMASISLRVSLLPGTLATGML